MFEVMSAAVVSQAASEAAGHGDKGAEAESPAASLYYLRSGTGLQTGLPGFGSNLSGEGGAERQDAEQAMQGPIKTRYKVSMHGELFYLLCLGFLPL